MASLSIVLSPFIYFIIYSSGWAHRYLFYLLSHTPALLYAFCGTWVPFTYPHLCGFFIFLFLALSYFWALQDALGPPVCLLHHPRVSHFSEEPWLLLLETGLETKTWVLGPLAAAAALVPFPRPSQPGRRGDVRVRTNLCTRGYAPL